MGEAGEPRSGYPINTAVEAFGDRWTLLVFRDIVFGDKRYFRELHAGSLEGIASNVLADRLKRLSEIPGLASRRGGECSTTCSSPSTKKPSGNGSFFYANIVHDALSASTPSDQDNLDRVFGVPAKAPSRVPKSITAETVQL